ncbi:MAG TPA: squalene synthase HpnC, partial [Candidatus Polarisedimenticolia bacterium]|nr:squalene synthase HpnC [Candidatus Polarisedimenticolia bacterium]
MGAVTTPEEVQRAYAECERLAREHYENFPVASLLVPGGIRPHVAAVYAFARIADDFADEERYAEQDRLALLDDWRRRLLRCAEGGDDHPVFVALGRTIRTMGLPLHPFEHLLTAFRMDVTQTTWETFDDLLGYCRYSANPVGQLVLLLFDHRDPDLHRMSDDICTALQLTNFWQDVAVDRDKGRCYLPQEELRRFGVGPEDLARGTASEGFVRLMQLQIARTREIFLRGGELPDRLGGRLGIEIRLTLRGGMKILDRIEEAGCDVFTRRPKLTRRDWIRLAAGSLRAGRPPAPGGG